MKISTAEAVQKMSHYVNYLAAQAANSREPLHVKQARENRLIKLSAALGQHKDLVKAIKVAYPEMNESQRTKLAFDLVRGLAAKIRKAANMGCPPGMMGAAGGAGSPALGGGGGIGPGVGAPSPAAMGTTQPTGQMGAGMQTAPSYSAMGAPSQMAMKA